MRRLVWGSPTRALPLVLLLVWGCGESPPPSAEGGAGGVSSNSGGSGAAATGGAANGGRSCGAQDTAYAARDSQDLFDYPQVPRFEFFLPKERWADLKAHARDEEFAEAELCFEHKLLGTVALRFKGSYGTLDNCFDAQGRQTCKKLSMKVKFDEYQPDLRFFGLKRLNFHSMIWDGSHLHERLGYDLYRAMGVYSPRSSWAVLSVNGETQGLFSMVEQVDGRFSKNRWPEDGNGNLYKEAWPISSSPGYYASRLESNEDTASNDAFVSFASELGAAPAREAREVLGRYTDLDYLASYMAVDDAIANWDGVTAFYVAEDASWSGNHNYYFYQETNRPFFWLLPWDLDSTFNTSFFGEVPRWTQKPDDCSLHYPVWSGDSSVLAPGCDALLSALASDLDPYRVAVDRLLAGPFQLDTLYEQIDRHAAFIRDAVAADPFGPDASGWQNEVNRLRNDLPLLRERLSRLAAGQPTTAFMLDPLALNDFESADTFNLRLGAIALTNTNSSATPSINPNDPIEGAHDLAVDFEYRDETTPWNQWLYFSIRLAGVATDARPLTGIRFRAKADRSRVLRVDLESPEQTATSQGIRFGWDVPLGTSATVAEVRFAQARVQQWAIDQGKDPHDDLNAVLGKITGIALNISCEGRDGSGFLPPDSSDKGHFQIDDLELF